MLEKKLIKKWHKRFEGKEKYKDCIVLEDKITDTYGKIKYKFNQGKKRELTYIWEHELYLKAVKTLEDEDWMVLAAYKVNKSVFLILTHKRAKNFLLLAKFDTAPYAVSLVDKLSTADVVLSVREAKMSEDDMMILLADKESSRMKKEENIKKRKQIFTFFNHWMNKESKERLKIITGATKVLTTL